MYKAAQGSYKKYVLYFLSLIVLLTLPCFVNQAFALVSGTMEVRDGWSGKDISYSVFDNRVEANWDYEAVAPVVRYEAAVGTTPYGTDVVNWTDIGLVNRIAFTTPELASGTTYYTSVRGLTQKKSVAIGGCSNGFIARKDPVTTDTDAAMFFNNARVLENLDTSGGRLSPTGTIANGNWKYCMPVTITEPNITDRVNAPCLVTFTIPAGQIPANINEFRVTDDCGNIVPRFNLTTPNNSTTTTPYIVFLVNMKQGQTRTYYIYWGSTGVGEMAHGFVNNTNSNSYTAWTPYYSRKDMPAGFDPVTISGTPILCDDDTTSNQNLGLSQFKFFGTNKTTGWYVNCNGYMSSVDTFSGDDCLQSCGNMFRRFTGNVGANETFTRNGRSTGATSLEQSICPLWVDLMQGTDWSESGVFSTLANNPTRRIYTWIAYRFNVTDDAYKMQAVLYQTGDIAIRYNLLNPRALVTDGNYDRGVNSSDEHTVGISNGDATHYLYHTPLQIGINQNPTAFYQCMNAFEGNISYGNIIGDGTNYDVAHIESMVFDSRLATPQWQKMICDATVTGSRRIQLYYRSGNSPLLDGVAWQGPTNITTTGQTSVNITTEGRYIQYKAVFQKTGTTGDMSIEEVKFLFGGISIETVSAERDGQPITEVSQGEKDIPVTVSVKNICSEAIDLNVATMTFTLGGHSATLVAPPLPLHLGVDEIGTLTYMVNIAEDAPTGLCTIDAMATATDDISDDGAQNPLVWTVKSKSTLIIEKVVSDKTEVTKGQTVTMNVYFSNTGDADCVFNTASPTFSVGKYTFTLASPAPGFVIPGNGSMIATYAVYISPDSGSGKDTINVVATATNKLSNEKIQANESEQPHAWTIQNPADLVLKEVIASETVYRGQKNNPVILRAENQGEAALEWDAYRSLIRFDPHIGSYENIRKTSGEDKVRLVSNQTSDTIFMVDIKADTATGTDVIDADIFGTEVNRNEPIEYLEGAIIPGQWTICAEKVNTYGDGSYKIEQNSFNMPTAGNTISVFGKVENLSINTEYVIHWFAPDGTELLTTYPQTSDGDGNLYSSIEINNSSQSGIYKITATNPLNTVTCCQNTFEVVAAASMVATFTLPAKVTVGQTFNASFTYINEGGAGIDSATLGDNVNFGGTGAADLIAPAPGRQFTPQYCEIAGYGQATATYTLTARTAGTLTLTNKASGYDANSHVALNTPNITSNVCTIQTAPDITITMNALPTTKVFLNQKNLRITATIRNLGQATAIVEAASITALIGSYDQELMGLEQPFELAYNESRTLTFDVGVRPDSNSGNDTLTINAVWYDKNWLESGNKYSHSESQTWNIDEVGIVLSADPNFSPEQNDFSCGQTVNVKAYGVEPNSQYYRIRFYTSQIAQAANVPTDYVTTDQGYSGLLAADEDGYIFHSYVLPNDAAIGTWSVTLESCGTSATTSYTTLGAMMGLQYFRVQASPAMSATLTIDDSEEIFVGDTFKVTLTVRNTVANSAAIVNINPYKLIPAAGSTGGAELVSGPEPATCTVRALESKSFEYVFMATADTGATNVAANRFKITSSDANYIAAGDNSNNCDPLVIYANKVTSNGLIICSEAIGVTNPVDFGHINCGDSHLKTDFTIFKVGNFSASNIRLNTADFNGPVDPDTGNMARISKSYFYIEPDCINLLERDTSITAHLDIPYNQKAGQYETTMFVYSDANNNTVYDNGEILAEFKCSVFIDECYLIKMTEDVIDMGDWSKGAKGVETTHMDVGFFNAGNMDLDRVKIDPHPIATATFDFHLSATNIGTMEVGEARTVQIWADTRKTNPEPVTGTYIATFTIWDDRNGDGIKQETEPWTTFQARITVGVIQFDLSPAMIEANGVETSQTIYTGVFPNFENLTIKNTGDLELSRIKLNIDEFTDDSGLNSIASSNVIIAPDTLVSRLQPGQTDEFSLALFIPTGTISATYTATVYVYHDDNRNDILDETEYRRSFVLRVYVAPTYKVQVMNHVVYMGGVSSDDDTDTQKLVTFLCRNTGNVPLEDLYFIPKPLYPTSGGTPIPISQITFPPTLYFAKVEAGEFFYPSILLTVPAGQADGVYLTADDCIIFNDLNRDGIKQDNETFDTFRIQVEVGELIIQVNPKNIKVAGNPKETSSVDSVTVQNIGSLDVINIIGSSTILTGPGGATIPSSASIFNPALTSTLPAGQSRPVNWSVNIPASQAAGTYTCNISIWGDSNNNGEWDEGEAIDTATGELYIKENPGIDIRQDSVDINNEYLTVNTSVSRAIEIENVGNVYIENLKAVKAPLVLGGSSLGEDTITVTFDSLVIDFEGVVLATYTISMGSEIMATGRYSGIQTVYADLNNNGSWDEGEPKDTFTLSVNIGSRLLELKPSPLDFGHVEVNSSSTLTVNARNIGDAPIKKLKCYKATPCNCGCTDTEVLCDEGQTYATILRQESKPYTFNLHVGNTKAGEHIEYWHFYCDDNSNGVWDEAASEYCEVLEVKYFVEDVIDLIIVPNTVHLSMQRGETATYTVTVINKGNSDINLADCSFLPFANLVNDNGAEIMGTSFSIISFTGDLAVGDAATYTISVTTARGMEPGIYRGNNKFKVSGDSKADYDLIIEIEEDNSAIVPSSTIHQEIASGVIELDTDWSNPGASATYFLSAWVCPGNQVDDRGIVKTAYANISVVRYDGETGLPKAVVSVRINNNDFKVETNADGGYRVFGEDPDDSIASATAKPGCLDFYRIPADYGSPVFGKSGQAVSAELEGDDATLREPLLFNRIYFGFTIKNYAPPPGVATDTFRIMLTETIDPSNTASATVYFDGIKLEKMILSNQDRPTTYHDGTTLFSPSRSLDVSGNHQYFEW